MSAIYNSTMSYSSKSYLDTLGSISLLNSMQISGPTPTPTTATTTLDVNNTNLSVSAMLNLLDSFNANQLNSYDIAKLVEEPTPNLTITNKNIVLFSTPLSSSFQKSDIKYHTSASATFLSDESFQKINTLVNEIFLMKPELTTYKQAQTKFPIFTFTEILRDTDGVNSYLCSIRVIFYNDTFYTQDSTFPNANALYFVISYLNVNNLVKLPSFNNVLGQISSTKRLMNFSYIVLRNFLNATDPTEKLKTFSEYIANSNFKNRFGGSGIYIFFYKLNSDTHINVLKPYDESQSYDTIVLHEQNPHWTGVDSKYLFASENDLIVSQATYNIYQSLINYFEFRKDMQFGVNYKWNYGQKHSSCMLFDITTSNGSTTTYMIGCGVNLETFIPISIKSTGDTLLSGDFNIKDINDNSIFQISNSEKKVTSAYKVGVGKDQPQTTMDIEDTSMASILSVIDKMSNTLLIINKNKSKLSVANLSTNSIEVAISSLLHTDNTSLKDKQTPFYYASIYKINNENNDYNVGNQTVVYNWLFGNSDNKIWNISPSTMLPKKLSELPSSKQLDFLSNYMLGLLTTKFIIPDTTVSNIYNWVYGKKLAFTSFFKNTNDSSSVYCFVLGIDLQQYNLRYNTNDNIEKLFLCIDTYQSLLQLIIKTTTTQKAIPVDALGIPLPQYIQATEKLKNNLSLYGNPTAIRKYTIPTNSVQRATGVDYTKNTGTLKLTTDLFNSPLTYTTPVNISSDNTNSFIMYQSLINRINSQYPELSSGENGIVWFEDSKQYYVSVFYCTNDSLKTIISIEFPLDTFIIPTVIVKGDTRVNGELSTRILGNNSNFTTIDPDRNFIGFGTDVRQLYYNYPIPNTKSPFFYVSNANKDINNYNYPCAVFDRSDANDSSLISTIVNVKRTLTKTTTVPVGTGLDIGFEITKNDGQTQRLGSIGMTIEDSNLNSGFFVKKFGATTNLMSISNSGQLSVDSILLTAIPSPPSITTGTLTINLGTSMFGSQTIVLTSNVTNIAYINGLENGTYTIKINLNGNTITYANSQTIFNATMNTNNSATVLLVKVNTFKNGNMQYFTNMTYYVA